jgi:hypothetical protein
MEKHNIFHGQFICDNAGNIVPANKGTAEKYNLFKKGIEKNQKIDVFMEANVDNATVPQIAKIHACIRELSLDTGNTFEDTKLQIKKQAGLCVEKKLDGYVFLVCKSFADCSKEELALAIEAIIQIGDEAGINFR